MSSYIAAHTTGDHAVPQQSFSHWCFESAQLRGAKNISSKALICLARTETKETENSTAGTTSEKTGNSDSQGNMGPSEKTASSTVLMANPVQHSTSVSLDCKGVMVTVVNSTYFICWFFPCVLYFLQTNRSDCWRQRQKIDSPAHFQYMSTSTGKYSRLYLALTFYFQQKNHVERG